jgi:O-methyltransferase involved in polyketide biosynthesis
MRGLPGWTGSTTMQFPLLVDVWRPVPADLSQVSLTASLEAAGFDCKTPTVWLCEALLYYLPLDQVTH